MMEPSQLSPQAADTLQSPLQSVNHRSEKTLQINFYRNQPLTCIEAEPKEEDSEADRINQFQQIMMDKDRANSRNLFNMQIRLPGQIKPKQFWEDDENRGFITATERKGPEINVRKTYCFRSRENILDENPEEASPYFRGHRQSPSKNSHKQGASSQQNRRQIVQLQDQLFKERQYFRKQVLSLQMQIGQKDEKIKNLETLLMSEKKNKTNQATFYMADPVPKFRNPFSNNEPPARVRKYSTLTQEKPVQHVEEYQYIIGEKEEHIRILIARIMELNGKIEEKNTILNLTRFQNMKLQSEIESVTNQIYVIEKKYQNQAIYNQFATDRDNEGRSRSLQKSKKADQNHDNIRTSTNGRNKNNPELDNLQKRLMLLKANRLEIEKRQKNRKKSTYQCQTHSNMSKDQKITLRQETASTNQGRESSFISFEGYSNSKNEGKSVSNSKFGKFKNKTFNK